MTDQPSWDETPQPTPDAAGQAPQQPQSPESGDWEPPAFRDWQHRLGPRHQPGSPTSPGNFLYLGSELRRPPKAPPPSS